MLNVILYHQKQLAEFIHASMIEHRFEHSSESEVIVSKGFTDLKPMAFTVPDEVQLTDYRQTDFDKSKIGQMIFGGFSKCLYHVVKFGSDTERRFAVILEKESEKWFRPAKGQFQIFYRLTNNEISEYIPDFVAETADAAFMIETKARNEMTSREVLAKKDAAQKWCSLASEHNRQHGGKPWKYLLLPHDEIKDNMSLEYFAEAIG